METVSAFFLNFVGLLRRWELLRQVLRPPGAASQQLICRCPYVALPVFPLPDPSHLRTRESLPLPVFDPLHASFASIQTFSEGGERNAIRLGETKNRRRRLLGGAASS